MAGIQEAFNNAFAQMHGYHDADALMSAVPKQKRIKTTDRQEQFNHAFALFSGFDNVDDMLTANGMGGTRGLKSIDV
jgi:hypothetical protein